MRSWCTQMRMCPVLRSGLLNMSFHRYSFRSPCPRETLGIVKKENAMWTYGDQNFYREIHEADSPLDSLYFFKKLLFGVLKRRSLRTYYFGSAVISIPQ